MSRRGAMVVVLGLAAGCGGVREPRWGGLSPEARPLRFEPDIVRYDLANGLRVALVPDPRTELVTVDVRYTVGAAEDPPDRVGLAHLVEHLSFMTRRAPGGPTLMDELDAATVTFNGWTSWDATHYDSVAPADRLDAVLALESRRMAGPCRQLDQATFERERDVVLSEHAQRRMASRDGYLAVLAGAYGADHPYARPVSAEAVAGVARDEACDYMARHYTPDRAVLVVTGPLDLDAVRAVIAARFGGLARGALGPQPPVEAARLAGTVSRHHFAVERATALVVLPYARWRADDAVLAELVRGRLEDALTDAARDHAWITDTSVVTAGGARAPVMVAQVEVGSEDRLEAAADLVFERGAHLFDGEDDTDLRATLDRIVLRDVATWDDLVGRGRWLADLVHYTAGDRFILDELDAAARFRLGRARAALRATISRAHSHVALVSPAGAEREGTLAAAVPVGSHQVEPWRAPVDPSAADRPAAVTTGSAPGVVQRYQLGNGLRVVLAPDRGSPVVDARLVYPVGQVHEPTGRSGLVRAAAARFGPDSRRRYRREDYERLRWAVRRGTALDAQVADTTTTFRARGLARWADWHLWYLSWWIDQGGYLNPPGLRRPAPAARDRRDVELHEFRAVLFGAHHPYVAPPTGGDSSGFAASELAAWQRDHLRARGATLIVSGGFDAGRFRALIDRLFGPWSGAAPAAPPPIPPIAPAPGPSWLPAYHEDVLQATVRIGFASRSDPTADRAARLVLREMLDEQARVVREAMGASYGVQVRYDGGAAGSALIITGDVDLARAADATARLLAGVARVRAGGAETRAELVRARGRTLTRVLARTGGATAVADRLGDALDGGQPLDDGRSLAREVAAVTLAEVVALAHADLADDRRVVQIVGPRPVVDAALAAARAAVPP